MMAVLKASAQLITGTVTDTEFGDPLPGVHIFFADDKNTLVTSDINGNYRIAARKGDLVFSMVGFDTKIVPVLGRAQKVDIRMVETASALNEVEVVKKKQKYSRKNNPAVEMMRKVIAAKKSSDLYQRDYFTYNKYEKMTMAFNEVTPKVFEDDHFKRFPFLKEHVEVCPETGKLILPLTVEEKVSRQIYRRDPKSEKTIVVGQRSEGVTEIINTGDIVNNLLTDCFTDVDIYKDEVRLLQFPFISPISTSSAIRFYRYFIADTLVVDHQKCFKLDFTPNNQQDFGFSGSLYVLADSTWRLKRVNLNIPPRSDINFVEHMDIIQDFEPLQSGEQVVRNNKMIIQLQLYSFIQQKLQVERTVQYTSYDFTEIPERAFKIRGDVKVESSAKMRDVGFWEEYRPEPLTTGESQMDLFMKRLQNIRGMKYFVWIGKAFIENFVETSINPEHPSKVDFGPVNTFVGTNSVEGFRLRVSAQTTANLNKHWFAKGTVKYGFGDQRWKGAAELTYSFNEKSYMPREYPVRSITVAYQNDVTAPSDKFLSTDRDNVFMALKWSPVKHMNYYERFNVLYDWEWENGMRLNLQARREWDEATGSLIYRPLNETMPTAGYDASSNVRRIGFAEATVSLKYQPGATYINTKQRRLTTNFDSPIMFVSHTVGMGGLSDIEAGGYLGSRRFTDDSRFLYNFTEMSIYKRFWMKTWGKIDCTMKGGVQWNRVPYPYLCMPPTNLSYIMRLDDKTFSLIRNMEFLNDRYAALMLAWDMNGKLLNRIPLIKRLKWREFIGCNMLWGMLTDKNNPFLERNMGDGRLFYFPGQFNKSGQYEYISRVMDRKKPYVELIVGLHNIFKILHIEYVHRMNYIYPGTQRWGIRGTFKASF
ncbi:MAG: carboxypeptidase-like regulatory domain-containing protein [Bacteroidaceae bacterium]|nr:carboxypeptidase-like regulatory domain-containing protein [Bacteroidaceae bacterium]